MSFIKLIGVDMKVNITDNERYKKLLENSQKDTVSDFRIGKLCDRIFGFLLSVLPIVSFIIILLIIFWR